MSACRWVASTEPRMVCADKASHDRGEWCDACTACPESHCRVCSREHVPGIDTCPGCLAEIARMCDELPAEVEVRGVDGEAFNLLGPAADPEARGHMEASVRAGRVPAAYLETADDENHPLFVAATWGSVYREAFDHDEPSTRVVLSDELGYLGRNLTYMAGFEHVPFEDFAKGVRACVAHLERVLHDSDRGERTNIDCLDCGSALERRLGRNGFEDLATCRGCKRRFTGAEYLQAVVSNYIRNAHWLSDHHMAMRTGVPAATVRSWARAPKTGEPLVRKEVQDGRVVYAVVDVELQRDRRAA